MLRPPLVLMLTVALLAGCGGGDGDDGSLTGSAQDDQLVGTEQADTIDGAAGQDVIEGRGGDDEIRGGDDADFLDGGDGADRFLESEDDAVDVHDCGPGDDVVAEPDARDEILPSCEQAGWTAVPPSDEPFENTIAVAPELGRGHVDFEANCPNSCTGEIELRTPRDRLLLGKGNFQLAGGRAGSIRSSFNDDGDDLAARGGYVRVVLRSGGVNSGFTTFLRK
jgi:hypothetical protein